MQSSDELLNPQVLTENMEQPTMSQEIQRLMQQYGFGGKPKSRHAKARAEAAKARIQKRKSKRK